MKDTMLYGLIAEFDSPEKVVEAAQKAYGAGYRKMDAYSPFPVHGLSEAMGFDKNAVGYICFFGGLAGCALGFGLQYYVSYFAYPANVGGRPFNSWPAFVPVAFELTVLLAALSAVVGMLMLNGLPRPYHPVFNSEKFQFASHDRFFLCIEAQDEKFDLQSTKDFLQTTHALSVEELLR